VLSEFSATSRVLNGGIRVNPWAISETRDAMERAVDMGPDERAARLERNLQFVLHCTATDWAERFYIDLMKAPGGPAGDFEPQPETIGFGLAGFRRAGWGSTFRPLDTSEVLAAYSRSRRRAIFLDWGGTLVSYESALSSHLAEYYKSDLSPALTDCLTELATDPRNLLMVLSGQSKAKMDAVFKTVRSRSYLTQYLGDFH
jgi:trehalose 6-phosphate synthase/phosphatase